MQKGYRGVLTMSATVAAGREDDLHRVAREARKAVEAVLESAGVHVAHGVMVTLQTAPESEHDARERETAQTLARNAAALRAGDGE